MVDSGLTTKFFHAPAVFFVLLLLTVNTFADYSALEGESDATDEDQGVEVYSTCINGDLSLDDGYCKCDQGWSGEKCDVEDIDDFTMDKRKKGSGSSSHSHSHGGRSGKKSGSHSHGGKSGKKKGGKSGKKSGKKSGGRSGKKSGSRSSGSYSYESYSEEEIDYCHPNPCYRGSCVETDDSYKCKCWSGWTGRNCHFKVNRCSADKCGTHGTCKMIKGTAVCQCQKGWTGATCGNRVNKCAAVRCGSHSKCKVVWGKARCVCDKGWKGRTCNIRENQCSGIDCGSHGTCKMVFGKATCKCDDGWAGLKCGVRIAVETVCFSNPCSYGSCIENGDGYTCKCDDGWGGDRCDIKLEKNLCNPNPCFRGKCTEDGEFYECECFKGWAGDRCNERIRIVVGTCEENCEHGTCTAMSKNLEYCKCYVGWTGGRCNRTLSKCHRFNCLHGTCNGDKCVCERGWVGDKCNIGIINGNCREKCMHGSCQFAPNRLEYCDCDDGWEGNRCDTRITVVPTCSSLNCFHGGCVSGTCKCDSGWIGTKCNTRYVVTCSSENCQHGACSGGKCVCNDGWTGPKCNIDRCPVGVRGDKSLQRRGQSCYTFVNVELTWLKAKRSCESRAGHLIEIHNSDTQNWVFNLIRKVFRWNRDGMWIGLNDRAKTNRWLWSNGDTVQYAYWLEKPNWFTSFKGHCANMRFKHNGKWGIKPCDSSFFFKYSYACEFDMLKPQVEIDETDQIDQQIEEVIEEIEQEIDDTKLKPNKIDANGICKQQRGTKAGTFYHPHPLTKTRYIQCDEFGGSFDRPCPPKTVWNQAAKTCSFA